MKKYIKPAIASFDMAPTSILEGSVTIKGKIGVSSFFTDRDDWEATSDESGNTTTKYNFWE